jgi:hypothetical protein
VFSQSFLEFSGYNNKTLAAGIVENNYLLVTIKPEKQFNIVLNNTLFIDKFAYQNFYIKFYYNFFSIDDFDFYLSPSLMGNYKNGFKYYQLIFSSESPTFSNSILSSDIIADFSIGKNIYYRLGLQYSFTDHIKILLKYGLPSFSFPEENYLSPGFAFKAENLVVEVLVQIPSELDNIQYARFTTSFLFTIF